MAMCAPGPRDRRAGDRDVMVKSQLSAVSVLETVSVCVCYRAVVSHPRAAWDGAGGVLIALRTDSTSHRLVVVVVVVVSCEFWGFVYLNETRRA